MVGGMTFWTPVLEILGVGAYLGGFARLAILARRRGSGHSLMAPFEDIWDPGAHRTHIEIQVQEDRNAPAPAPGDPPDLLPRPFRRRGDR